jgi:Na+(H+)/acetate symporter ActP
MAVSVFVVVVVVVTATLVGSLRAHTQTGVQTAAILWLVLGLLWAFVVVLAQRHADYLETGS